MAAVNTANCNWSNADTFKLIELLGGGRSTGATRRVKAEQTCLRKAFECVSETRCRQDRRTVPGENKKAPPRIKKIKDNHNLTGRGRSRWKFYHKINEILGNRPATRPPVLLDTLSDDSHTAQFSAEIEDPGV